jgi:hypothetical protein
VADIGARLGQGFARDDGCRRGPQSSYKASRSADPRPRAAAPAGTLAEAYRFALRRQRRPSDCRQSGGRRASLRLIKGTDGKRVPAVELLLRTPYVADLIEKGEVDQLEEAMKQGINQGMPTFDESLYQLYTAGRITLNDALDNADSRTDLALRIRLNQPMADFGDMSLQQL